MEKLRRVVGFIALLLFFFSKTMAQNTPKTAEKEMLIRIAEIEIYPEYREAYLQHALQVGATSVREEAGVIAIYPMVQQKDPCQIRILEIYADQEAYRQHIASPHFKEYKEQTLHMVKRLDLVDMYALHPKAMPAIFRKMFSMK